MSSATRRSDQIDALDRQSTAPLEKGPDKGAHTYVVMAGSAEYAQR